jgi:hypothetical protein
MVPKFDGSLLRERDVVWKESESMERSWERYQFGVTFCGPNLNSLPSEGKPLHCSQSQLQGARVLSSLMDAF